MSHELFHLGIKALISNPGGDILLLKVDLNESSGNDRAAYWDLPGGRVEKNETTMETLNRELREETELVREQRPATFVGAARTDIRIPTENSDVGLILFVYKCPWDNTPEIHLSDEHVAYQWANLEQALEALSVNYPPEFIQVINEGMGAGNK
jgi:8-oxo-dGTP pyrophosphatase MutT (NUDIX family)